MRDVARLTGLCLVLVTASGCGEGTTMDRDAGVAAQGDTSWTPDAASTLDEREEDTLTPTPDASGAVEVSSSDTLPVVGRDPGCPPAELAGDGAQVPWSGFSHEGEDYTCNRCVNGIESLQGRWRLVDFATEDPETTLTNDWRQIITFDGNTWEQRARWESDTGTTEASLAGWYWCASKPELNNEATVFVVSDLSPSDAFGYGPDYVFSADLLESADGGDKFAFWFYDGFNRGEQVAEIYCRIGGEITTLAGETRACPDPFAP